MENPWRSLRNSIPYVLNQDLDVIQSMNAKYVNTPRMIQTQLLPEPFIGNIEAPIIVLTKNPGFDVINDPPWHSKERFKELAMANLFQETSEYPFFFLNPEIKNSPGAEWHKDKLKALIRRTSLKKVAQTICSIPCFPYHTLNYTGLPKTISDGILPSQKYTRLLVMKAIERQAIIILGTGKNAWSSLVPELFSYQRTYFLHNHQRSFISPGNLDQFEELVITLG